MITADEGLRGGKHIPLKSTVDLALAQCPHVKSCVVYQHTNAPIAMKEGRDLFWAESLELERGYAPCEPMDSEDVLFMLFTSGSTGQRTAFLALCSAPDSWRRTWAHLVFACDGHAGVRRPMVGWI